MKWMSVLDIIWRRQPEKHLSEDPSIDSSRRVTPREGHIHNSDHLRSIFGVGWFFEWPEAKRLLNSTWPWAGVKLSIMILWGVCWMFYMPRNWQQQPSMPRPNSQPGQTNPNPSPHGFSNIWGNNTHHGKLSPPAVSLFGCDTE